MRHCGARWVGPEDADELRHLSGTGYVYDPPRLIRFQTTNTLVKGFERNL
jgi:hypothetical protein